MYFFTCRSGVHSSKWREANALKNLKDQKIVEYIDSWEEEASVDWLHRSVGDRYVCYTRLAYESISFL